MAFLIKSDGHISPIKPRNGKHFSFEELYNLLNCECVQLIKLDGGYYLVVDESGALNKHRVVNTVATEMYQSCCPTKEQRAAQIEEYRKIGFVVHELPGNEENLIYGNAAIVKRNQID